MISDSTFSFSRRAFLGSATLLTTGAMMPTWAFSLSAPSAVAHPPVPFPHFPDPSFAFIWRNWNLVPLQRLAQVLGAKEQDLRDCAKAMGLPKPLPISDEQWNRSYITIIRRNWHLLPKDQLTELLGWTAEHLEFTLQEDDFLYIKLGSIKPDCPPLRWKGMDVEVAKKLEKIRSISGEAFAVADSSPGEPLFDFVRQLSAKPALQTQPLASGFSPRYGYGYFTLFGDPLADGAVDPFPEGYLQRMGAAGLDGTWLHIVLSKVTPFTWDPSLSKGWEQRLENLARLVEKCRQHGIGMYLYLNEPRYQPLSFYKKHPSLKGVTRGQSAALCTSAPEVQAYLVDSIARLVERVPGLAGFFSITASENPTHCWSHFQGMECPRCGPRGPEAVIAELNTLYATGIQRGLEAHRKNINPGFEGSGPRLIAWDWGWRDGWAAGIVPRLPKQTALMSVSEWDLPIERGGVKASVGEYSISAVGPGPRAKRHWEIAQQPGLETFAKIQAGTTWECGGLPYVPALENVAQHAVNLRDAGIKGLMTGWTLGGYPGSPNLEVVSVVGSDPGISVRGAMVKVADKRYGAAAEAMVAAWYGFSEAFREFPYHIGVVYNAPVHSGPANLLWARPTGYSATMVGLGYDDLSKWRDIYPADVFIRQLYRVAEGFEQSLERLEERVRNLALGDEARLALAGEMRIAEAVGILYRSVANQADFIRHREQWEREKDPKAKIRLQELLLSEIQLANRLFTLQQQDSRIGFEATNHYFYVPTDLQEKVLNCRWLLEEWLGVNV
ncbi:hypothetical protein [Lunatimonas salinarum]|uniref:hypothetical protein n=1 Tax=Lunatimonas salinarum TaxID=1774590 RepID=UPI001FD7B0C6|nr:hypothetical protein [Lunatimonas salinarum]